MYKKIPEFLERTENKIESHLGSDRYCKLSTVLQSGALLEEYLMLNFKFVGTGELLLW